MKQPTESSNARAAMSKNENQLYNRGNRRVNNDEHNNEINKNNNISNENNLCENDKSNSNNNSEQNRLQQQQEIQNEQEEWNVIQNTEQWGDNCIPIDDGDEDIMRLYC